MDTLDDVLSSLHLQKPTQANGLWQESDMHFVLITVGPSKVKSIKLFILTD